MSGQRQPIELLQAKGAKNLTKAEIKKITAEIKPIVLPVEGGYNQGYNDGYKVGLWHSKEVL